MFRSVLSIALLFPILISIKTPNLIFYNEFEGLSIEISHTKIEIKLYFGQDLNKSINFMVEGLDISKSNKSRNFLIKKISIFSTLPKTIIKCHNNHLSHMDITYHNLNMTPTTYHNFCIPFGINHRSLNKVIHLLNHSHIIYSIKTIKSIQTLSFKPCLDSLAAKIKAPITSLTHITPQIISLTLSNNKKVVGHLDENRLFISHISDNLSKESSHIGINSLADNIHEWHHQTIHQKSHKSIIQAKNRNLIAHYIIGHHYFIDLININGKLHTNLHEDFNLVLFRKDYKLFNLNDYKFRIRREGNLIIIKTNYLDKNYIIILKIGNYNRIIRKCWYVDYIDKDYEYLHKEIIKDNKVVNFKRTKHCKELEEGGKFYDELIGSLKLEKWKYIKIDKERSEECFIIYFKKKNYAKSNIDMHLCSENRELSIL